jgi:hypothetical protein
LPSTSIAKISHCHEVILPKNPLETMKAVSLNVKEIKSSYNSCRELSLAQEVCHLLSS